MFFSIYFKKNIQNFFVLVYFVCHTPQFKMLVLLFKVKSGSRKIEHLLFSRIFVYLCYGNIDFHKM